MRRAVALAVAAAAATCLLPPTLLAQTAMPAPGTGVFSAVLQDTAHTGHRLTDGTYIDNGRSRSGGLLVGFDYGLARSWAVTFNVPLVWARYTDDDAPPPFLPFLPVDTCRCWHAGVQDLGLSLRRTVVDTFDHQLVVTPSVGFGVPSHDYAYRGEAVLGRRLREARIGVDVSRRIDGLSRRVAIGGTYTYSIVERVLDLRNDRSQASVDLQVQPSSRLAVRTFTSWQRTHGGLRVGSLPGTAFPGPGDLTTVERIDEHDRLLRDNRLHVGIGATYSTNGFDVFGSWTHFASGTDTHAGRSVSVGISMPVRFRD